MTQAQIVTLVIGVIPYPQSIKDLNLNLSNCIQFEWYGDTYRVGVDLSVCIVQDSVLTGGPASMLLSSLLKLKNQNG